MRIPDGETAVICRLPGTLDDWMRIEVIAALAAACIVWTTSAGATTHAVTGEARDARTTRLLYREHHVLRPSDTQPAERLIVYRCADGIAFARKRADYRTSRTAPEFAFEDARSGHREGLRRAGGAVHLRSGKKERALRASPTLVADAGFDEYLRAHWATLAGGGERVVPFAVPAFGRALDFRITRLDAGQVAGTPVERFRLTLDGMLGALAPKLDVDYDARSRRLRRFTGVTDLRDDRGKPLNVRIDFPQAPVMVPAEAWSQAESQPLRACKLG